MDTDQLAHRLAGIVGNAHVLADRGLLASYETDFTGRFRGRARLVVRPSDTAEVAAVVRVCAEARAAVVPQGGNTGLVGGSVPVSDEVVVSLRRLDSIGEVDHASRQVTTGAGVVLSALQQRLLPQGWDFGVDLAARESATLGGMIATNAGGERVLRYGTTRANIAGLTAVLADGSVLERMGGLPKDNTGYDLTDLLVGSEGTLAVITAARLRLVRRPAHRITALLALDSIGAALEALDPLRELESLELAEFFLADGLELVCRRFGLPAPFPAAHPVYLLVECAGRRDPEDQLMAVLEGLAPRDAAIAVEAPDRHRLAAYRELHSEAVNASGVPVKLDVTLPLSALASFTEELPSLLRGRARPYVFGHLAEGNAHVNLLDAAPGSEEELTDMVLRRVAEAGGSISAEHGIGRAKAPWLHLSRSLAEIAAMRAIKDALDPAGLLNPGVLLSAHPKP